MSINDMLLVLAAVLPAFVLCRYVYKMDKVEKEPKWLLGLLFFFGVISCFPAAQLEEMAYSVINGVFNLLFGMGLPSEGLELLYNAVTYFIGVALIEEGVKWLCLVGVTKKNKHFNCFFDGLIYAVFVSLGFAAFENILYVLEYGWWNAFMRAILSVPGHMFFSVMMGYYYSRWMIIKKARETEIILSAEGVIEERTSPVFDYKKEKLKSILIPVLFHGTYNFCCSADSLLFTVIFYAFVGFMYVHCFGKIKSMSSMDTPNGEKIIKLLTEKYPELYKKPVGAE